MSEEATIPLLVDKLITADDDGPSAGDDIDGSDDAVQHRRVVALSKSVDQESWVQTQIKTFTAWMNIHLRKRGIKVDDVISGVSAGVNLCHLMEELTGHKTHIPPMKNARFLIHKLQNASIAIEFIERQGIKLVGVGSEDVVNGNVKIILGLIWTLIMRYQVQKAATSKGAGRDVSRKRISLQQSQVDASDNEIRVGEQSDVIDDGESLRDTSVAVERNEKAFVITDKMDSLRIAENDDIEVDYISDGSARSELLVWVKRKLRLFRIKVCGLLLSGEVAQFCLSVQLIGQSFILLPTG